MRRSSDLTSSWIQSLYGFSLADIFDSKNIQIFLCFLLATYKTTTTVVKQFKSLFKMINF